MKQKRRSLWACILAFVRVLIGAEGGPPYVWDVGQLFGRVLEVRGNQRVAAQRAGVIVDGRAPDPAYAFTGDDGVYRLSGPTVGGKCVLQVRYRGEMSNNQLTIVVGNETRAVLELERAGQGWTLRRG